MSTYLPRSLQNSNELMLISGLAQGPPSSTGRPPTRMSPLPLQWRVLTCSFDNSFMITCAEGRQQSPQTDQSIGSDTIRYPLVTSATEEREAGSSERDPPGWEPAGGLAGSLGEMP